MFLNENISYTSFHNPENSKLNTSGWATSLLNPPDIKVNATKAENYQALFFIFRIFITEQFY